MKIQKSFTDHGNNVAENDTENSLNSIYSVTIFKHNSLFLHSDNVWESTYENIITEIKKISMICQNAMFKMRKYY